MWSSYRPGVAQRVGRGIALLFHDRGTRRGWVVSSTHRPHFTPGKTRYQFYRRLGGHQGRSERAENFVPTEIRSRTVQPVVSRCPYVTTGIKPMSEHAILGTAEELTNLSDKSVSMWKKPVPLIEFDNSFTATYLILWNASHGNKTDIHNDQLQVGYENLYSFDHRHLYSDS